MRARKQHLERLKSYLTSGNLLTKVGLAEVILGEGELMAAGTVKWFNNAKGYGFILPDGGGEDLFAHFSAIQMDGYKTLKAGDPVEYLVVEGPKGLHADNIRSVPDSLGPQTEELSAYEEPSD